MGPTTHMVPATYGRFCVTRHRAEVRSLPAEKELLARGEPAVSQAGLKRFLVAAGGK